MVKQTFGKFLMFELLSYYSFTFLLRHQVKMVILGQDINLKISRTLTCLYLQHLSLGGAAVSSVRASECLSKPQT